MSSLSFLSSDNLIEYSAGTISIDPNELNIKQTLLGGQSFRWTEHSSNEFIGVISAYIIHLKYENNILHYKFYVNTSNDSLITLNNDERQHETSDILHNYFQLSIKLDKLFQNWSKNDERFRCQQVPSGIRVLAQDPLENLISFICSSNNNVQRITKMIRLLCSEYGKLIGILDGTVYHQFPTLDELDKPDIEKRLRELNFGYRARYIQQTIHYLKHTVNDLTFFDRLKSSPVNEARSQLLKIMGVGRKVADCVLLMSLDKQDVVPVDTHIHSIAIMYYGKEKANLNQSNYEKISTFFEKLWSPYAGWAQAAAFSNELNWTRDAKQPTKSKSLKRCLTSQDTNNQRQTTKSKKRSLSIR